MTDQLRALGRAGRATRAYLAGIGTSGSLLAGAALMFILASALVAFRGWPHVAAQPSPGQVIVSPRPASASAPSAVGRRLAFITAATPAAGARGAIRGAPLVAGRGPASGTRRTIGTPVSSSRPPIGGGSAAPSTCGGCGAGAAPSPIRVPSPVPLPAPVPSPQQVVQQTTGSLGSVVSGVGSTVSSAVQHTTGAVGGAVGTVSQPARSAVSGVGSATAQTNTGATQSVAGAVPGLGQGPTGP